MSDTKEAILAEYNQVLKEAGETQYRMKIDSVRLEQLNKRIYELNMKAAELQGLETKPAESTEATPAVTTDAAPTLTVV